MFGGNMYDLPEAKWNNMHFVALPIFLKKVKYIITMNKKKYL